MLQDRFSSASAFMASKRNLSLPSATKLALYADYKLATEGLCTQLRPSLIEFEKSAKWKAWKETGDRYLKELDGTAVTPVSSSSRDFEDSAQLTLPTMAMISYVKRVEDGQWGWTFNPSESVTVMNATNTVPTMGDQDLDELEAYLGVDKDELSAEELLVRPYVPIQGQLEGATMTASGISTMAFLTEEELGDDPLESAKRGPVESLQAALAANPKLASLQDDMGFTMLHWACDRGSLDKVKTLIETYNAEANAQDSEGSTPLHCACLSGWPEVIGYLKGLPRVDQSIRDHSGLTAEEYLE